MKECSARVLSVTKTSGVTLLLMSLAFQKCKQTIKPLHCGKSLLFTFFCINYLNTIIESTSFIYYLLMLCFSKMKTTLRKFHITDNFLKFNKTIPVIKTFSFRFLLFNLNSIKLSISCSI